MNASAVPSILQPDRTSRIGHSGSNTRVLVAFPRAREAMPADADAPTAPAIMVAGVTAAIIAATLAGLLI